MTTETMTMRCIIAEYFKIRAAIELEAIEVTFHTQHKEDIVFIHLSEIDDDETEGDISPLKRSSSA
jgi:hypothetical protein